jgi:hypothetical protein
VAFSAWRVAVLITGQNLSGPAFASLSGQASAANATINRTQASVLALRATALTAFAAIGVAMGAAAYDAAGKFQLAMTNVGIATGASAKQMKSLSAEVLYLSNITAQSAVTTGNMMAASARTGINNPANLAKIFPSIAKLADVQQFLSGADPVTTAKLSTQLVHLFQAYSPQTMDPLLNEVHRLMLMQPETLNRVVRQAGYFVQIGQGLHLSNTESVEIMAAMGRTGLMMGRGGTGAANTILGGINAVTMTQHLATAKLGALLQLGVIDAATGKNIMFDAQGHVTLLPMLQKLASERDAIDKQFGPGTFTNDLIKGFGLQGGRFLSTLATPVMMQQIALMSGQLSGPHALPGIDDSWLKYTHTLPFVMQQLQTNFTNLLIVLASPSMGNVIVGISGLVNALSSLVLFFEDHPGAANAVMAGGAALTGAAAIGAAATTFQLMRMIWAHGGPSPVLPSALRPSTLITNPALADVLTASRSASAFPLASGFPASVAGAAVEGGATAAGGAAIWAGIGGIAVRVLGIVGLVVTALQLFEHLPDIGVAIYNWWAREKDQIAYNIGFAFGWMTKMLIAGAQGLATMAVAAFGAVFSSQAMSAAIVHGLTGNQDLIGADFSVAIAQAIVKAGGLTTAPRGSIWNYGAKGFGAGLGQPPPVVLHATATFNINGPMDSAAAKQHAKTFVDYINRLYPHATRSSSSSPRSLRFAPATLGSLGNPR